MPVVKKAAAGAPAKAARPTVTRKQLGAALSEDYGLPYRQVEAMLGDLVALTTRTWRRAKNRLNGNCHTASAEACSAWNPATGEAIKIKASKKAAFRVAKELKEAVIGQRYQLFAYSPPEGSRPILGRLARRRLRQR